MTTTNPLPPRPPDPLEVLTFKFPRSLREEVDRAAAASGRNRTQTVLTLLRWALAHVHSSRKARR